MRGLIGYFQYSIFAAIRLNLKPGTRRSMHEGEDVMAFPQRARRLSAEPETGGMNGEPPWPIDPLSDAQSAEKPPSRAQHDQSAGSVSE